jgi:hypothetical protein
MLTRNTLPLCPQIMDNKEISYVKQILGLQHGKDYSDVKSLRYGQLMIMTDQDHDGSHIKGLLINFLHAHFPSLLKVSARARVGCVLCGAWCLVRFCALTLPLRPPSDPQLFGGVHHAHHQGHQGQAAPRVPHHARVRARAAACLCVSLRTCCNVCSAD